MAPDNKRSAAATTGRASSPAEPPKTKARQMPSVAEKAQLLIAAAKAGSHVAEVFAPPIPADPPAISSGEPSVPAKPQLLSSSCFDVDVLPIMRATIAYVKATLRQRMKDDSTFAAFPDVPLHEHGALNIHDEAEGLRSYKAPWRKLDAQTSLRSTGLYEASGNLFWTSPFPDSPQNAMIAGETPSWDAIEVMARCFDPTSLGKHGRILFPVTLTVHASSLGALDGDCFNGSLQVLMGHAAIYGWFVATFRTLDGDGDGANLGLLWQAALTVTLQAWVVDTPSELAVLSMKCSNDVAQQATVLVDSFPAFARKLYIALVDGAAQKSVQARLAVCKQRCIRFQGSLVHRTLLLAAFQYHERVGPDCHAAITRLERAPCP